MRRTTQFNTAMEISPKLLVALCFTLLSSMTTAQEHNPFKNTAKAPAVQKQAPALVPVFPVPTSPPPPQYMPSQPYAPPVSAVPYPPSGPTMARELPPPVIPVPQEYPVDSASSSEAPQKTQSTDEPSPKKKATGGFLNRDQIKSMRTNCHFEIKGDSMLPLPSGSLIIAEYVENWHDIKTGQTYVIVSSNDGIVYKRIEQKYKEDKGLKLVSDNKTYEPYWVEAGDIIEVWKAKAFISTELPEPSPEPTLEGLSSMMAQMQKTINAVVDKN